VLGYTSRSWDGEDEEEDDDAGHLPFHKHWATLLPAEQKAATVMGYTRVSWEDLEEAPVDQLAWAELSLQQQRAAMTLGWTRETWDSAGVADEDQDGLEEDEQQQEEGAEGASDMPDARRRSREAAPMAAVEMTTSAAATMAMTTMVATAAPVQAYVVDVAAASEVAHAAWRAFAQCNVEAYLANFTPVAVRASSRTGPLVIGDRGVLSALLLKEWSQLDRNPQGALACEIALRDLHCVQVSPACMLVGYKVGPRARTR
jgi:hypothetical protein